MASIVLATLNAKFPHSAFGLRYLLANMNELRDQTVLREFTINQPILDILDAILREKPRIVGFGVYIWNIEQTTRLVADLKRVAPDVIVILGGPEVSYESDQLEIRQIADWIIAGEADVAFAELCRRLLSGESAESAAEGEWFDSVPFPVIESAGAMTGVMASSCGARIISARIPATTQIALPYDLYTDEDIAQRVIYVEASRGCPYTCEFCLSALEIPVRQFPLEAFLAALQRLLDRGALQFKFVDRTFNLNLRVSQTILEFFLERYRPGMFLHFELIPDRLPDPLRQVIVRFPAGSLQFEVGVQTFNDDVSELISRRQDNAQVERNLSWLRHQTGVHVHADLIVGLPGESLDSFAAGFDRLVRLKPQEIQIGILKRLRGTPIIRHDEEWEMVYSPHAPYEILRTKLLDHATIGELRRFARLWDSIANSGHFVDTIELLWHGGAASSNSPFQSFRRLVNWIFSSTGQVAGLSLTRLVELLLEFMTTQLRLPAEQVATALWTDYQRGGRSDRPHCLRQILKQSMTTSLDGEAKLPLTAKRQQRHQSATLKDSMSTDSAAEMVTHQPADGVLGNGGSDPVWL